MKAIIFDCFGVLVTSSYEPFKQKHFGDDEVKRDRFHEIEDRSSRGEISLEDASSQFALLAGLSYEQAVDELHNNPRNITLLNYIATELKDYKIGFLSNVADDRLDELFTKKQQALFDDIVLSYDVNMAKPDPRIFALAADRLGVTVDECVFVDDNYYYCQGAEKVGMKVIQYENFPSLK